MMAKDCNTCKYEKTMQTEEPCRSCSCCEDENNNWVAKKEKETNKNYVREFMEDNKLKINVEFPVKSYDEEIYMFHFDDNFNLKDRSENSRISLLFDLLTGITEISPLPPFSPANLPKQGEQIWFVADTCVIADNFDKCYFWMLACVASGNAFRTAEEAEEAAPRIRKEQGMTK